MKATAPSSSASEVQNILFLSLEVRFPAVSVETPTKVAVWDFLVSLVSEFSVLFQIKSDPTITAVIRRTETVMRSFINYELSCGERGVCGVSIP